MTQVFIPPLIHAASKTLEQILYPDHAPNREGFLTVGHGHEIFYRDYGHENGVPVVFLHGGPGGGTSPIDHRMLDPKQFRIITFDQRGAGRSRPHAEVLHNDTAKLIDDIELLREACGVERWLVFGGSWGSALALAYGQAHADKVLGFILRGIFLGSKAEFMKLWLGMGDIYPEAFAQFQSIFSEEEKKDVPRAMYRRLTSEDHEECMNAARAFIKYDITCATIFDKSIVDTYLQDDKKVLAMARLFTHYSVNEFFLSDDQLIKNMGAIKHLPAAIVHGRYDIICRASSAYKLHQSWPGSTLTFVQDGGHASSDPALTLALKNAGIEMPKRLS